MFWKVRVFIEDFWKKNGSCGNILEVGSRNINGSARDYVFGYKNYTGIDMIDGDGVDIVLNGHDLYKNFDPQTFDYVFCFETLEHDSEFWRTVYAMKTCLKSGGWLVVTVPGVYFFEHDYPSDYYRFTEAVFRDFIFTGMTNIHLETYDAVEEIQMGDPKPNRSILGYAQKI